MSDKRRLLEPFQLGTIHLKNRIVLPPMEARLNRPDGSVNTETIDFYEQFARGGVGMIIVQNSYIDEKASRSALMHLGVYSDHLLAGLGDLAETIRSYGVAAFLQISHGGRQANPAANPFHSVGPSAIPCKFVKEPVRELTIDEIEEIQESYAQAARRVQMAGFNGVELHGAHGYLINQFLSPYTNHRSDKYGGSFENRSLFPLEVIKAVRAKVGEDFLIGYRMSAEEYVPGGLTIEDTTRFARVLESAGVDYLHVSVGIYESNHRTVPPTYFPDGYTVELAGAIKKVTKLPVITVGAHTPETGEKALREGKADLVAFGRALVADPELPNKLSLDSIDDIRPCVRSNEGCYSRFLVGGSIRCEVNPACGREKKYVISKSSHPRHVVVVGGGIAGLEAARVAALRGHDVTLIEKDRKLGGHLLEASAPEFKTPLRRLLNWAQIQVEKVGVRVTLGTEATPEMVTKMKPDTLIVAIGSEYIKPKVPGVETRMAKTAQEVLLGGKLKGDKVVVVGGGYVGCETALFLAEETKKEVVVVESMDDILTNMEPLSKWALTERLQKCGVRIHTGWCLHEITDKGLVCLDKHWEKHEVNATDVVLAMGLAARSEQVEKFKNLARELYIIGDCAEARNVYHAFEDAWRAVVQFMC